MAKSSPKLNWCVVRLGEDMNWWVQETSDPVHWDTDGLSIIDPRQIHHLLDLTEPLRDYGFDAETFEDAFYKFSVTDCQEEGQVRLARSSESVLESEEKLFCLPDILDEEKGPYADLIDHLSKLRVKMLNDVFEFEQKLNVDELEEVIREEQNADFMEGRATHAFEELARILEYVPEGYELDEEDDEKESKGEDDLDEDDIPDIEVEDDENIEKDETMRWDEDDEEEEDEDEEENLDDLDDEEEEDR